MTISTVTIDPSRLPINWQTGTTYTITVGSDFVREVGNNRSPSPVRTATITTFALGPEVSSVTPAFNASNSFTTLATLVYNRFITVSNNKKYSLYETTGTSTNLVLEIDSTSSRVLFTGSNVTLNFTDFIKGNRQYHLLAESGIVKDRFNFNSVPIINNSIFKYTVGAPPTPISVSPTYNSSGLYVSTATITFDRNVNLSKNNIYLYNSSGVLRTFISTSSSNIYKASGTSIAITLYDQAITEGVYYIGYDLNSIKDANNIPANEVTSNSLLKWTSKSISDLSTLNYDSRITNSIFSGNWYSILDRSSDSNEQYTLTLSTNSGTFVTSTGTVNGGTWTYTGTRQQLEAQSTIRFSATTKNLNWDLPLTTTLTRDGIQVASRSNTLIGIPYNLNSMTLVSNTFTNSVSSSTVLTVTANTNSSISSQVQFKSGSTVLGTSTFVNNVASLTLQPDTLSQGTYNIIASWGGQTTVPKFNGTDSSAISQTLVPKASPSISLSLSTSSYAIRPEVGTTPNSPPELFVRIPAGYPTHSSIGSITLKDSTATISTGILSVANTQSTVTLTWDPSQFNQIDNGVKTLTASYLGDYWNTSATSTISFTATTKNRTTINVAASTSALIRPDSITFTATTPNNNFSGKSVTWYEGSTQIGTSSFTGNTATLTLNSMDLAIGLKSVKAEFAGDYNFEAITSNIVTFTVEKRTPTVTLVPSASPLRKPSIGTITATYRYNGSLIDRTGRTITFKRNGSTIDTQTASGSSDEISQDSMALSYQNYSYTATLQGDDTYNEVTSNTLVLTIAKGILSPDITFNPFYPSATANPTTVTASLNSSLPGTMTLKHTFQGNTTTSVVRSIATLTNTGSIATLPITLEAGSAIDSVYSYPGIHTFNLTATGVDFEDVNYSESLKKFDYSKLQFLDITPLGLGNRYPSYFSNVQGGFSISGYELGFKLAPFKALLASKAYENVDNVNENIRVIVRELNSLDISDIKSGGKAVDHTLSVYQTAWSDFRLWNVQGIGVSAILIRGDKVAITGYSSNFSEFPGYFISPSPYYSIEIIYEGDENNDIPAISLKGILDITGKWNYPNDTTISIVEGESDYFLWHTAEFTTNTTTNLTVRADTLDSSKSIDGFITITGPNNYPIASGYPNTSTGVFEANWSPIALPNYLNYMNDNGYSLTTSYPLTIVISTGTNNKSTSTTYGYRFINKEAVSNIDSFLYVNGYTVTGDPNYGYGSVVSGSNILGRTGPTEYVTATTVWSAFGTTSIYMRYGNTSTLLGSSIGQPSLTVSPPGGYFTATTTSSGIQTYVITAEYTSTFVSVPPLTVTIQKSR
jgi:hypothetical protein